MNSTNDKIKGNFNRGVGKAKEMAGQALNDQELQDKGQAQKNKGDGQKVMGTIKEKIRTGSHDLGDNIEKVGRKLQEKGHGKIGRKVEELGDKLEHSAD